MCSLVKFVAVTVALFAGVSSSRAGSATWDARPVSNLWRNPANWTPATEPNGEDDVATLGSSSVTRIILTAPSETVSEVDLGELVFQANASPYALIIRPVVGADSALLFYGSGITNNSGITQTLVAANSGQQAADSGRIYFEKSSSAGGNVVITNQGATSAEIMYGAFTSFWDSSTAADTTVINEGCSASGTHSGGSAVLLDYSSAENATFINNPGTTSGAAAGNTLIQTFPPTGNLGTSTFIANAAKVPGAEGGWVEMDVGTCAGTKFIANGAAKADCQGGQIYAYGAENDTRLGVASYTANGGTGAGAQGGLIDIYHLPLQTQTVVVANTGSHGGAGGLLQMEDTDDMPVPQFQVFGNGTMDLSKVTKNLAIGSLAGDGLVNLAGHNLTIGGNNLGTAFSGVISGSGKVTKAGTGTFALNGVNTYSGLTTLSDGAVGGSGSVAGSVTVVANATLAPAAGAKKAATFTIGKSLTFQASSNYTCLLAGKGGNAQSDQVAANGVIIASGAQFNLVAKVQGKLKAGTSFTVISNTASTPISGTFANLPDGAILTVGNTKLQASYGGGDGNDLTLTVVP
jgi:autotransporter-associated beta strand protein